MQPLLEIADLVLEFDTYWGPVRALAGVDLALRPGEVFGLVGESGCGKSVTALAVTRLLPANHRVVRGQIRFSGRDLLALGEPELERVRGRHISMIFQEPMTSLNPTRRVGSLIAEVLRRHQGMQAAAARARAVELLRWMRIPDPERVAHQYPFQLSGGMRQRVMIALALACGPELIIADEPTTALDVTVQGEVLRLLGQRAGELGTSVLLITHDLGVVAETCQRVAVMYAGQVVEMGPVAEVLEGPRHPYTRALLAAHPARVRRGERLTPISGSVPSLLRPPAGCRFHPRCPHAREQCRERPAMRGDGEAQVACWLYGGGEAGG